MTDADTIPAVDWSDQSRRWPSVGARTLGFLASVAAIAALFVYDYRMAGARTLGEWDATPLNWLALLSVAVVAFYGVAPLVADRERAVRYWRRFRRDRLAVAGLAYLAVFVAVGALGPVFVDVPPSDLPHAFQPPAWASTDASLPLECVGQVSNGLCHGTWQHPLGTNAAGKDLLVLVALGARVSLVVALVSTAIVIPLATAVGTVAGYVGGWVDAVAMRYVDVQQTVPAFLVYVLLVFFLGRSLFLMVVAFGLFGWGGVARMVRSEALQRREEAYTRAALAAGAGPLYVVRRHILSNVSSTVVTAATLEVPVLVLTEAALSFLELGDMTLVSWGRVVAGGLETRWTVFPDGWWISLAPVLALGVTVLSLSVVGDALRDATDPRERV